MTAATLLPSECPNCGRLHQGHDFNENRGPIQAENERLREENERLRSLVAGAARRIPSDA